MNQRTRCIWLAAWMLLPLALELPLPGAAAHAASFDCAKARSKLHRTICADAELSALDERVWNAYGALVPTLSSTQYAHVRERHVTWRRQRGWFERSLEGLKADYQRHLAWLTHPLLPLEGRYEAVEGRSLQVDIDPGSTNAVLLQGEHRQPFHYVWVAPLPGDAPNLVVAAESIAEERPALVLQGRSLSFMPAFIGRPWAPRDCQVHVTFGADEVHVTTTGECGGKLAGSYQKPAGSLPTPPPAWMRVKP